ncbi:hypothetical protein F3Y22_tig00116951pilonHSYRG00375 [Hibiscus syriacus]|uniref:Coenzyme Q-binding protein COQ10 START domain-containing protein n=1 Tax=Hibiscus syriacus TaxID=106335 RepID=A0A6A2WL27_HIBSY|nr:uncharacterized protein LOC120188746 [Hibiscus syriacus]KAE8660552.1 hypothetical protein F3Y22_tig00116951pilonHSYRG00375 [Hibiscus syriacus]
MRAYPIPLTVVSTVSLAPFPTSARFLLNPPTSDKTTALIFLSTPYPRFLFSKFSPCPFCSNSDATTSDTNEDDDVYFDIDDDGFVLSDDKTQSLSEDGVFVEVTKLGRSSRRIRSKIGIEASLDTVWNILTDYEKLSDVIPALTVSKVVEKKDKFARLYQIGQQNLPLGLKFNAKGVIDCYEKDLEILPSGKKREIQFKMVEGDFIVFEGTWLVEQFNEGKCEGIIGVEFQTTLSYSVDLKPKMWLPVQLVESRLSMEIKTNLLSIHEEAKKVMSAL